MIKKHGQSMIEYVILIVVVISALIAMQVYMKRGVQGRWKTAVDELGDMYDPQTTKINLIYNYETISNSKVDVRLIGGKLQTMKYDNTFTNEIKTSDWITPLQDDK